MYIQDVRLSTQGVLYADLGPSSKKVQAPLILNDSHVEYAELNHQSTTKQQKAMDEFSTAGMIGIMQC